MVVDILWCVVALFLWCGGGHFVVCSCTVYMVWWWTFCCGVYLYCFYGVVVDMLWCVDVLCFYGVVVAMWTHSITMANNIRMSV